MDQDIRVEERAVIAAAYTVVILVLLGCCACALSVLPGHQRLACLGRSLTIRVLIAWTLLLICAVKAGQDHRMRRRYGRVMRGPVPEDGARLTPGEFAAFAGIVEGWRHPDPSERSRT
jgi:hypothetical protein